MQGSLINDVLEDAFENFLSPDMGGSTGSFPNAAGLRWEVDYTKPFGGHVNNIEMNPRLEADQWEPLVMDRNFTMVTNNFISAGIDVSLCLSLFQIQPVLCKILIKWVNSNIYVFYRD